MSDTILSVKNLTKVFRIKEKALFAKPKELYALNDVTLSVSRGETLGIIGESGCGKSTFGKCVVRLHKPTAGSIIYRGLDLANSDQKAIKPYRRHFQMVFQDPFSSLDPRLTAADAIEEAMLIHNIEPHKKRRQERIIEVLREVGLDVQHANRYPHEFSGGQRQRINIARVLSLDPELIVCDEPVSALDVSIQAQVLYLLKVLQLKRGLNYLFISHDLSVIKHVSTRIAIMYLGKVVELCSAQEKYHHPLHPYTNALLSAIPPESPFDKRDQIKLYGDIPTPIGLHSSCPLHTRCTQRSGRCMNEMPSLKDVGGGHFVACFLYDR